MGKNKLPQKEIAWSKQEFNDLINKGAFESPIEKICKMIWNKNEFLQYSHIMLNLEKYGIVKINRGN